MYDILVLPYFKSKILIYLKKNNLLMSSSSPLAQGNEVIRCEGIQEAAKAIYDEILKENPKALSSLDRLSRVPNAGAITSVLYDILRGFKEEENRGKVNNFIEDIKEKINRKEDEEAILCAKLLALVALSQAKRKRGA